jgi:L-arabinonolactonase
MAPKLETIPVDCVLDAKAMLGESPLWSAEEQKLYWVDIYRHSIHCFDPASGKDDSRQCPEPVGSIGFRKKGGLISAMRSGFFEVDFAQGMRTQLCNPEADKPGNRMNDGRCDPWGAFWAGSMMDPSDRTTRAGTIWRLGPDRKATAKVTELGISNGIAFDGARRRFYCADTYADVQTIWRFDIEPETGEISNRQVFATTNDLPGRPDGAALDSEGCYWSALAGGWSIARFTPEGKVDRLIKVPVEKPTMCAFGGRQFDVLFITSIGPRPESPLAPGQPQAGGIFACRPGVQGLPEPKYAG